MFAFKKSNVKPEVPVIKTLPATASTTYKIGDALVLTGGKLAKATGTTIPRYICACNYSAPAQDPEDIAVNLIAPGMEWDTTFAADASSVTEGSKVTIHTDAAQVTATTTSGIVTILKKYGDGKSGTAVRVTFDGAVPAAAAG